MSLCPFCKAELGAASRQLGRCAACGASLRIVPQRTVVDFRPIAPQASSDPPRSDADAALPEGASPELAAPARLEEAATGGEGDSGLGLTSSPGNPRLTTDGASSETLQTIEFSSPSPSVGGSGEATLENPTWTARPFRDSTSDSRDVLSGGASSESPLSPEEPLTPVEKPATVTLEGDKTVDFSAASSGEIDLKLLTSQWRVAHGTDGGDSRVTIRQKETVGGGGSGSSSLFVKSRQIRSLGEEPAFIASPADAPDYELLQVIGEGGMGVVYAARQSSIARTVALKMLKSGIGSSEQRDKFISEAVVTGELDHPNIVPIYDLGSNSEGALFYSMKRVKGTPWSEVLSDKSLDENLNILLRVCDAVAFAHVNGVIHRDLKPENVMLGDYGEVLVMDWGLARIRPEFSNASSVTQSNAMGGTPAYMAPELATGPIERVTSASDVYLLGAMLHEIVTGKPPHKGSSVMNCLYNAAQNHIVETTGSGELYDIALRAMATEPENRHADVKAFQNALREYQAHSESILLTNHGAKNLEAASESEGYDLYARTVYGLEEAIVLWEGNRRAKELLVKARLAYAERATDRGDFDLGASLLDSQVESHRALALRIEKATRERNSRQRALKLLKGAVAALVAAVVGVVSFAYYAVSQQRDAALFQRDRAVRAEGDALENFQEADKQRQLAQQNEAKAVENAELAEQRRQEAEVQRRAADEARQLADQRRDEADQQRSRAVAARQAEEYAAYVARIGLTRAKIEENAFDRAAELLDQCTPDLRHWEWGRLRQLCLLNATSWARSAPVSAVAYAPNGRTFAAADWQGKLALWDVDAAEPRFELEQGQYVHAVAFDPLGKRLASGSSDHTVRIVDAADGRLLKQLQGHDDAVLSVAFSPDGRWLATSGFDKTARIWDVESGKLVQTLHRHSWWVWTAAFSPDGQRLVTAGQDGRAIVWQRAPQAIEGAARPFEYLTEFNQHRGPVYVASFVPKGDQIVTGGYDGRVLAWNPDEVQPIDLELRLEGRPGLPTPFKELIGHRGPVRSVAFSPRDGRLATGGQDNLILLWDLATGAPLKTLRGHASHVRSLSFSPDGAQLLSAGRDHQIKLWSPDQYAENWALGGPLAPGDTAEAVLAAAFSHDGRRVVTAGRDRTARLWNAHGPAEPQGEGAPQGSDRREPIALFAEGHDFLASSAHFFAEGERLATGAGDGTVRIWDVASGAEVQKLLGTGAAAALDVTRDGNWIVTGGMQNSARVWDVQGGEAVAELTGHDAEVTAVAFAPDGQLLATADQRGAVRLWRRGVDARDWRPGSWMRGHSRTVTSMEFVAQGTRLVTSSGDNTCAVWDVASEVELKDHVLKHPDWVADMAIAPDGKRVLTSCDDGKLRLWSLETAQIVATLELPPGTAPCTSVDLSADGRYASAVRSASGAVHVWDLATGKPLRSAVRQGTAEAWLDVSGGSALVWAAIFSPSSDALLTLGGNDAQLYDLRSLQVRTRFHPHGTIASVDISPDGTQIVTGSWDGSAKIWNVEQQRVVAKLDGVHRGFVNSVEFSPDGRKVLTASDDGEARLWDVERATPLEPVFQGHQGRVTRACFSPDGARVLTVSSDKTARLWDAQTGETLLVLEGHAWGLTSAAFASGGQRVITGGEDNVAIVWDAETGKLVTRLPGHTGSVTCVALSSDGKRALTGSEDTLVKVWDAEQGKEVLTLAGHREGVTGVEFSPDDLRALSSGRDGRTLVWPAVDWRQQLALPALGAK